jgi:hypothetical protein
LVVGSVPTRPTNRIRCIPVTEVTVYTGGARQDSCRAGASRTRNSGWPSLRGPFERRATASRECSGLGAMPSLPNKKKGPGDRSPSPCVLSDRRVTVHSGHMGDTSALCRGGQSALAGVFPDGSAATFRRPAPRGREDGGALSPVRFPARPATRSSSATRTWGWKA